MAKAKAQTQAAILDQDELDAIEVAAEIQAVYDAAPVETQPAPIMDEAEAQAEAADEAKTFAELAQAVTEEAATVIRAQMIDGIRERARFERDKCGYNEKIQKTLSKTLAMFDNQEIAKQMFVAGANPNLWNVSEVSGARRNVYSFEKIRDILAGAARGHLNNPSNQAVIVSLVRCAAVKLPFTMAIAKGCASDKTALPPAYHAHCRRHNVASSTGNTQASSTMTALEVLGVVENIGSSRHQEFRLTDTPIARAIVDLVRTRFAPIAA